MYLVLTGGAEQVPLISMTIIAILAQHTHIQGRRSDPHPLQQFVTTTTTHWPPGSGDLLWIDALDHLAMYLREIDGTKHPGPRPPEPNVNKLLLAAYIS